MDIQQFIKQHPQGTFLRVNQQKRPLAADWQNGADSHQQVIDHADQGGLVGVMPASIGYAVVDVDSKPHLPPLSDSVAWCQQHIGTPACKVASQSGVHLWYPLAGNGHAPPLVENRKWQGGELRGHRGYVVLWHPEQIQRHAEAHELTEQDYKQLIASYRALKNGEGNGNGIWSKGNRNTTLNERAYALAQRNAPPAEFQALAKQAEESGLGFQEIQNTIHSAQQAGEMSFRQTLDAFKQAEQAEQATPPQEPQAQGQPVVMSAVSPSSFRAVLQGLGVEVGFDVRLRSLTLRHRGGAWRRINDRMISSLRSTIEQHYSVRTPRGERPYDTTKDKFYQYLETEANNREFDPVRVYYEGLPEWDGVERLPLLLHGMFGATDTPLNRHISTSLLLGPYQRTLDPGCRLREMVVLMGPQGIGKSALLEHLFPQELGAYTDSITFYTRDTERVQLTLGKAMVEMSEMIGSTRRDVEHIKAYVSRTTDEVRLPWHRHPTQTRRRFTLVGTSNSTTPLPDDPSGTTRFLAIQLEHGCAVEAFLSENREQLHAEAVARYARGERANLPRALMVAQQEQNQGHQDRDDDLIEALSVLTLDRQTSVEIGRALGMDGCHQGYFSVSRDKFRLKKAMGYLGYRTQRIRRATDGKRVYVWIKAEAKEETESESTE